ncbi:hydroxylysine kinase-like [Antedon mediterranea]|uniref:hydroxylysine kinase-like n=1 Tax=Antedon mediterranea TaxID=105859 RepID=UPI003AF43C3E
METVGISEKPIARDEDIQGILSDLYELDAAVIKSQESYNDQVFYISTQTSPEQEYILRVFNHTDSKKAELTEIIDVLVWLNQQGVNCPKPLKNKYGDYVFMKKLSNKKNGVFIHGTYAVCLYNFVKGIKLMNVESTDDVIYKAGQYLAQLQITLKGVEFPLTKQVDFYWNFDCIRDILRDNIFHEYVRHSDKRELITKTFNMFVSDVDSRKSEFEKGLVHSDYNESNILVESFPNSVNGTSKTFIVGIIDFFDLCYNPLVYDVAIGLLYMMLMRPQDMLTAGGHFLAGYQSKRCLKDIEKEAIIKTTSARLAQSLVSGLVSFSKDPENVYLLKTQTSGWDCLSMLSNTPEQDIWKTWDSLLNEYDQYTNNET